MEIERANCDKNAKKNVIVHTARNESYAKVLHFQLCKNFRIFNRNPLLNVLLLQNADELPIYFLLFRRNKNSFEGGSDGWGSDDINVPKCIQY